MSARLTRRQAPESLEEALAIIAAQEARIERLEAVAYKDDLTGLMRRSPFLELVGRQIAPSKRANLRKERRPSPIAVFAIDLVGFKTINDTMGHAAGDCALRFAAQAMADTFRDTDLVCRMGGDEFAAAAWEVDALVANAIIARLLGKIRAYRGANLNARVGCAIWTRDVSPTMSADALYGVADAVERALKQEGAIGGRVHVIGP